MQALRKMSPARGLSLEPATVPGIGPTDVLVRVKAASICGTDLHIYGWDRWSRSRIKPPVTLGHEFCGVVEKVGSEVEALKSGDFVSAEMHVNCGHCHQCRVGEAHICPNVRIIGIDQDGAFAELVKIPASNIIKLEPAIPERYGAILDPLGNAVHTVLAGAIAGQTVLVTGCGPIGLFAIGVARAAGAARVFASDLSPYRLELARRMNADAVIDVGRESFTERVQQLTGGQGLDGVLEMSGNPQAMRDGLAALRNGGRLSLLGLPKEPFELDWNRLVIFKGATIHGIIGRRMYETWYQMDNLLGSGRLDIRPAITHVMAMEKFEEAIALLRSGKAGKVVLVPWGESG